AVALILAGAFWLAYDAVPWAHLMNVPSESASREARPAAVVLGVLFLIGVPLGIVARVQAGYQEGFKANVWLVLGGLLSIGGVILAIKLDLGLAWFVAALIGGPLFAVLLNGIVLFVFDRPWLRPRLRHFRVSAAKQIVRTGSIFLVLQIAGALAYQAD